MAASVNVRDVDGAVGADEAVARFRDKHSPLAAHDAAALTHSQLYDASIKAIVARPAMGSGRGFDLFQVHKLTLRLGHDFVFDYQDIPLAKSLFLMREGVGARLGKESPGRTSAWKGRGMI